MKITLKRDYLKDCTVGHLLIDGVFHSQTMELPWKENQRRISCIPEGEYELKRYRRLSGKMSIEVYKVPNRTAILIHAGNDATQDENGADTQGCILPNTTIAITKGKVRGSGSIVATNGLYKQIFAALDKGETVKLIVCKNSFA
jgi:hypothetical protein